MIEAIFWDNDGVLVDTEHLWALGAAALGRLALEEILKPALDSGAADPFPPAQTAAADPIPVSEKHTPPERLSGPLPWQDARKSLPETAPAVPAQPFTAFQLEHAMSQAPTLMPQPARPPALASQPASTAVRAQYRPTIAGRYPHRPALLLNACNLVSRQA